MIPELIIEELPKLRGGNIHTLNAIFTDYNISDGAATEIKAAFENLVDKITFLLEEDVKKDDLIQALSNEEISHDDVLRLIKHNTEEEKKEIVQSLLYEFTGFTVVQTNSLTEKEKLENFLRHQLYPNCNDQNAYIL